MSKKSVNPKEAEVVESVVKNSIAFNKLQLAGIIAGAAALGVLAKTVWDKKIVPAIKHGKELARLKKSDASSEEDFEN